MHSKEKAIVFECNGESLLGILHEGAALATTGIVLVVGGPQYRVGSHRQFVLIARYLAEHGTPVFRFDYRGMGDSDGKMRTFEEVDADIRAAVNQLTSQVESITNVVLWGLCDAASASCFYAAGDPRIKGLVLLNPWVRTEQGLAKALITNYYFKRFCSKDFWSKLASGRFEMRKSLSYLSESLRDILFKSKNRDPVKGDTSKAISGKHDADLTEKELPIRVREGMEAFKGRTLLILSENDLTAAEFLNTIKMDRKWRKLLRRPTIEQKELKDADHTFSSFEWRTKVCTWTLEWAKAL